MPQLNPAPWLIIFIFSWAIVIILMPMKISKYIFPNQPSQKSAEKPKTTSWSWPWR